MTTYTCISTYGDDGYLRTLLHDVHNPNLVFILIDFHDSVIGRRFRATIEKENKLCSVHRSTAQTVYGRLRTFQRGTRQTLGLQKLFCRFCAPAGGGAVHGIQDAYGLKPDMLVGTILKWKPAARSNKLHQRFWTGALRVSVFH